MKKIFTIILSSSLLWSCNEIAEKKIQKEEVKELTQNGEQKKDEHHDTEKGENIELNNGAKWAVNTEMKPHVLKGEELVHNFVNSNNEDYKKLSGQLKEQNDDLIKSCTMNGKSHDELHKWLHPHLELTKELAEEKDTVKVKSIVTKLQSSYKNYHDYFN